MNIRSRFMALCFSTLALCAQAGQGFFEPIEGGRENASSMEAQAKGLAECGLKLEKGQNYSRITDAEGKTHTLTYDEFGRLAEYEYGNIRAVVVYDASSNRAKFAYDRNSGRALPLDTTKKDPAWIANLRAQGRLPSVEKIINRACARHATSKYLTIDGEEPDWTLATEEYWIYEFDNDDYFNSTIWDWSKTPCELQGECITGCDQKSDWEQVGCIAIAGSLSIIGNPAFGVAVGVACAGGSVYKKWECRAECQRRFRC